MNTPHYRVKSNLRQPVLLNVYDLHPHNTYTMMFGLGGAFHTGVEIGFTEYSFGGTESADSTGVFECEPRLAYGAVYRETIEMGYIDPSTTDFKKTISKMRSEFMGRDYHILNRNCNTFCNELLIRLVGHGIPTYVTRLSKIGSFCSCLLPESLTNPNANRSREELDSIPILPSGSSSAAVSNSFKPFTSNGYSLADTQETTSSKRPETAEERRVRCEKAALNRFPGN